MQREKHQFTWSEVRGIFLVILGWSTLAYYYSWWFTAPYHSIWLVLGFCLALLYGLVQLSGTWMLYLATHYRPVADTPTTTRKFTIDVFVTACGEEYTLVEKTLKAVCAMRGEHRTWLLDDGDVPSLSVLATCLGVGYLTRTNRHNAKAGNINAALAQTEGDIIVIFDVDHAPRPDFLEKVLGYFANPEVGFVQVMLTFGNRDEGWVAEAAADTSLDFYNPASIGADGLRSATLVGSNALVRRQAFDSIQGYHAGLAEDLVTSIALHAAGWRSIYVAEPLAPGLAPPTISAWFTQQLKWSRGVFELLLTAYPRYFKQLRWGQRLMYAVRMTYYWVGLFTGIHILLTILKLWQGSALVLQTYQDYLIHLFPLAITSLLIRQMALRRWRHPTIRGDGWQWKSSGLVFASWSIYTLTWLMSLLRIPLRFQLTPKTRDGSLQPVWLLPQVMTTVLLLAGMIYAVMITKAFYGWVFGFAIAQIVVQLLLIVEGLRPAKRPYPHPPTILL